MKPNETDVRVKECALMDISVDISIGSRDGRCQSLSALDSKQQAAGTEISPIAFNKRTRGSWHTWKEL